MSEHKDIKMVAIDIDGTLLGPDGTISQENAQAVQRLKSQGLEVILASGRSHANMLPFHTSLQLTSPLVSVHGAVVRESSGRPKGASVLPEQVVRELTVAGREADAAVMLYRDEGVFFERRTPVTEFDQSRNAEPQKFVADLLQDCSGVHKVMWLTQPERIDQLKSPVTQRFSAEADIYHTDPPYLEFVAPGVSKAVGLGLLAEELGLKSSEIAAFGDGNNDVPMLAWAGIGVAVAHATEAAKSAARLIGPEGPADTALARAVRVVFG